MCVRTHACVCVSQSQLLFSRNHTIPYASTCYKDFFHCHLFTYTHTLTKHLHTHTPKPTYTHTYTDRKKASVFFYYGWLNKLTLQNSLFLETHSQSHPKYQRVYATDNMKLVSLIKTERSDLFTISQGSNSRTEATGRVLGGGRGQDENEIKCLSRKYNSTFIHISLKAENILQ